MDKSAIVQEIRKIVEAELQPDNLRRACLTWAKRTVEALERRGIRAILQAGTCCWPLKTREQDDGKTATHFSYMYEGFTMRQAIECASRGHLPEMHVWAAIPEMNEIIDLSTKYWPEQAKKLAGLDWPGIHPPDYLWTEATALPDGVIYHPYEHPTALAYQLCESGLLLLVTQPGDINAS